MEVTTKTKIGDRYGLLTVVANALKRGPLLAWKCLCECGGEKITTGSNLRLGLTKSCGCWRKQFPSRLTHGKSKSVEYDLWINMKERCCNPKNESYSRYGALGITVCPEWRNSFESFFNHLGLRPSPDLSIERIDNLKGYEPGNVKWGTVIEQANNKRNNRHFTYHGKTLTIAQWARKMNVPYMAFFKRLQRGEDFEYAVAALNRAQVNTRRNGHGQFIKR